MQKSKIESNPSEIESNYRKLTLDSKKIESNYIFVESRVRSLNLDVN